MLLDSERTTSLAAAYQGLAERQTYMHAPRQIARTESGRPRGWADVSSLAVMRLFATFSILGLGLLSGCPTAPTPSKVEASEVGVKPSPTTKSTEPAVESGGSDLDETPAWFDISKFDHAKILQAKNQAKVGASLATATLLELQPGTTTEDCMTAVRTEMAKSLSDLAEAVPGDKGRMTLQGKTSSYSYTVVCGPGKAGQTTLYLSYTGL